MKSGPMNPARPMPSDIDRPPLAGLRVPEEFYLVLERPARLAGMASPSVQTPWERLAREGFRFVVCLTDDEAAYDPAPIEVLHAVCLEDLFGGLPPADPEREADKILVAVDRTVAALRAGDGVIVHCAGGTGRTGTVIGGVLRRLGCSAGDARGYLGRLHRARDAAWPESPWARALLARILPVQ